MRKRHVYDRLRTKQSVKEEQIAAATSFCMALWVGIVLTVAFCLWPAFFP